MPANNDCIDASAYLRELCGSISRSKLQSRNIELVLVERPFQISSERCWLMGMIVSELITNAVRHAFDHHGGTIRLECRTFGGFVECRVSDNGSASTADVRPGTGLRIIDALAQALGADFQFDLGEDGSEAALMFPIDQDCCVNLNRPVVPQPTPRMSCGTAIKRIYCANVANTFCGNAFFVCRPVWFGESRGVPPSTVRAMP